jgi:hypothetical protein
MEWNAVVITKQILSSLDVYTKQIRTFIRKAIQLHLATPYLPAFFSLVQRYEKEKENADSFQLLKSLREGAEWCVTQMEMECELGRKKSERFHILLQDKILALKSKENCLELNATEAEKVLRIEENEELLSFDFKEIYWIEVIIKKFKTKDFQMSEMNFQHILEFYEKIFDLFGQQIRFWEQLLFFLRTTQHFSCHHFSPSSLPISSTHPPLISSPISPSFSSDHSPTHPPSPTTTITEDND